INLLRNIPRRLVLDSIREEIDSLREDIKNENVNEEEVNKRNNSLIDQVIKKANRKNAYELKRVVNGTGVVIHTNLGRSLINEEIMENVVKVASNYSNLEYNLENGQRGSRYDHLNEIITEITG